MKNAFCVAVLFLSAIYSSKAQTDSVGKAKQILKLEQQLMDAMPGNTAPWDKYLDDKWRAVTEDGAGYDKASFLKTFKPFAPGYSGSIKVSKPVFVFYNNVAVVHYVADEHETIYGQKLHTTYATTDTWYEEDRNWKMLSSQTFEVPQLPLPVKLNPVIEKNYVGTYSLSGKKTAVITLKNDTLYLQKNNKTEALLPETTNVFFRKGDARGRKLFVKDKAGNMLLLERRNGNDLTWKKVK